MTDRHNRAETQLDVSRIDSIRQAARKIGTLSYANFGNDPRRTEKGDRAFRNLAREFLPKLDAGLKQYSSTFLVYVGWVFNGIYSVTREYESVAPNFKDSELMDVLADMVLRATWPDERKHLTSGSDLVLPDTASLLSDEGGQDLARWFVFSRLAHSLANGVESTMEDMHECYPHFCLTETLMQWVLLHHNMVVVDPTTAEMCRNTDPPTKIMDTYSYARVWPMAVIHAGDTGETYMVNVTTEDNVAGGIMTRSISETEFPTLRIMDFPVGGHDALFRTAQFMDGDKPTFELTNDEKYPEGFGASQPSSSLESTYNLVANVYAMAAQYPTYIKREDNPKSAAFGKKSRRISTSCLRLQAAVSPRTITQIVDSTPRDSESCGGGGWEVKPHWRRGYWRRVFHGVKWECANPDTPVYEDDKGRYHIKFIEPVLVNKCKFTGDIDKENN